MATVSPNTYPFSEIPAPGMPVTNVRLYDSLQPLLLGLQSQTAAFAQACLGDEEALTGAELFPGLTLLAGQLGFACELLARWSHDDDAAHAAEQAKKR